MASATWMPTRPRSSPWPASGEPSLQQPQGMRPVFFLVVVAALFAGYGTAYLASDDIRYLTRAGIEETRILQARQPIAKLAEDPRADPALREALGLVVA